MTKQSCVKLYNDQTKLLAKDKYKLTKQAANSICDNSQMRIQAVLKVNPDKSSYTTDDAVNGAEQAHAAPGRHGLLQEGHEGICERKPSPRIPNPPG